MEWTRGRFLNEYIPGLFTVALDSFMSKRAESMYGSLCNIKNSLKKRENDSIRSGLGYPTKKGEGAGVNYDVEIEGPQQTWVHDVWALAVRITEESIDDNLYHLRAGGNADELSDLFEDLGQSMALNIEAKVAALLNFCTVTTYHQTRFSTALASTAQQRLDGSTYSNLGTSTDLTYSTFWTNLIAAENQLDHRQLKIKKTVEKLWIPPQLERAATEIIKSSDRPDTANRAVNAYAQSGRKISLKIWNEITNPNFWMLQTDGRGIIFLSARKTRFAREREFQTGDMMCKSDQRFSVEIADERDFYINVPN